MISAVIALQRLIQCLFVLVLWIFWAIFGTAFWFALIFRTLSTYTAVFLYAHFTQQNPKRVDERLHFVADFWFRGFRNAYGSVFGKIDTVKMKLKYRELLLEVSWSVFFWSCTMLATSLIASRIYLIVPLVGLASFIVGMFLGSSLELFPHEQQGPGVVDASSSRSSPEDQGAPD